MKPSPQFIVYVVGVAAFGLAYGPVKAALGGQWLFLAAAVGYLIALRFIGSLVAKALARRAGQ